MLGLKTTVKSTQSQPTKGVQQWMVVRLLKEWVYCHLLLSRMNHRQCYNLLKFQKKYFIITYFRKKITRLLTYWMLMLMRSTLMCSVFKPLLMGMSLYMLPAICSKDTTFLNSSTSVKSHSLNLWREYRQDTFLILIIMPPTQLMFFKYKKLADFVIKNSFLEHKLSNDYWRVYWKSWSDKSWNCCYVLISSDSWLWASVNCY